MAAPKLKYAIGNEASTTPSSSITDSDTTISLTSDTNFSAKSGEGMILMDEGEATQEWAYSTGKTGSDLAIPLANRGLEGGSAQPHTTSGTVKGIITAGMWNDLVDSLLNVLSQSSGAVDTTKVVTLTGTQTLSGKTLTSPVINTGVSGTAVLDDDTFATASDSTLATSESIKAYVDASGSSRASGQAVGSTANPTTTSSSYATLADMSVSITTQASASVLVVCSSSISNTNSSLNYLALDVDGGTEVAEVRTGLNNSTGNITTSYLFTGLTAASHTFRARWKTSAGTLTGVETNRSISVVEI